MVLVGDGWIKRKGTLHVSAEEDRECGCGYAVRVAHALGALLNFFFYS
ncbi:MAG: hypothetical protein AAF915_20070 [Cyanobacteria bacterium P01_D01_bin.50]